MSHGPVLSCSECDVLDVDEQLRCFCTEGAREVHHTLETPAWCPLRAEALRALFRSRDERLTLAGVVSDDLGQYEDGDDPDD